MRLIDADKLGLTDYELYKIVCKREYKEALAKVLDQIADAPTVCDIEQIRAEIIKQFEGCYLEEDMTDERKAEHKAYENVLQIIDKYTK